MVSVTPALKVENKILHELECGKEDIRNTGTENKKVHHR